VTGALAFALVTSLARLAVGLAFAVVVATPLSLFVEAHGRLERTRVSDSAIVFLTGTTLPVTGLLLV
jgi:ABC-type nitrate/sulfonate/bicarbonate transport system permease component